MGQTFWGKWGNRVRSAWDVLIGRAWAGYGNPADWMLATEEVKRERKVCSETSRGPLGLD